MAFEFRAEAPSGHRVAYDSGRGVVRFVISKASGADDGGQFVTVQLRDIEAVVRHCDEIGGHVVLASSHTVGVVSDEDCRFLEWLMAYHK